MAKKQDIVKNHEFYMKKALKQAYKAFSQDEVPIGALIVAPGGHIIAKSYNKVEQKQCQIAHAEIRAIEKASKKMGNWRLEKCWIYVTLEPCAMCMNLILLSRFAGIVFGARSPIFGYQLDKQGPRQLYRKDTVKIIEGICETEASGILKQFFKQKRNKSRE